MTTGIEHIIIRYIAGEATAEEAAMVESWIAASPANKEAFERSWKVMEQFGQKGNYQPPTVTDEWNALKNSLQAPAPVTVPKKFFHPAMVYATVGLVVAAVTLLVLFNIYGKKAKEVPMHYSGNQLLTETLPNGVKVFLDKQSSIGYGKHINDTASIPVNGGAYFEAANYKGEIIHIRLGKLTILAFKSNLFVRYDSVERVSLVHVLSGTTVVTAGDISLSIDAGESISYNEQEGGFGKKDVVNINLFGFATKVFDFNDMPLKEAVAYLEKAYGVPIQLQEGLSNCRITTRFDNKTLKEVLDVMAFTLGFSYEQATPNGGFLLKGKGCE